MWFKLNWFFVKKKKSEMFVRLGKILSVIPLLFVPGGSREVWEEQQKYFEVNKKLCTKKKEKKKKKKTSPWNQICCSKLDTLVIQPSLSSASLSLRFYSSSRCILGALSLIEYTEVGGGDCLMLNWWNLNSPERLNPWSNTSFYLIHAF